MGEFELQLSTEWQRAVAHSSSYTYFSRENALELSIDDLCKYWQGRSCCQGKEGVRDVGIFLILLKVTPFIDATYFEGENIH